MSLHPKVKEWQPPTLDLLILKGREFLRQCKPKEYSELKLASRLDEICRLKAVAAQEMAKDLIESGVFEREAWNRAIRFQILESETE